MMRYAIITREFTFEAAHRLPNHQGKCRHAHGHLYRLQVSLRKPVINPPGKARDGIVKNGDERKTTVHATVLEQSSDAVSRGEAAQARAKGRRDHHELTVLTGIRTTAENLVYGIWDALLTGGIPYDTLYRIRLWETEKGYVEITHAEHEQACG